MSLICCRTGKLKGNLSFDNMNLFNVEAYLFIERISKWSQCRVRLIQLRCVLNPQDYHWYAAALIRLPRMVVSRVVYSRWTRGWTVSSATLMGTTAVTQFAEGWRNMICEMVILKSNQRHMIRRYVNHSLYGIKLRLSEYEWWNYSRLYTSTKWNSRYPNLCNADSEADALTTRPLRTPQDSS